MAEYIEREALRNSVEFIDWYSVYKGKLTAGAPNTENALYKASSIYAVIDNAPAADVADVVHGEWLRSDDDWNSLTTIQCSCCGEEWCFEMIDDVTLLNYKYCPNCGARMDGGAD